MVGVGKYALRQFPGPLPGIAAFVQQNAHQFRDRQRGMGIVDMDSDFIRQIVQCTISGHMVIDNIPH